MVRINLLPTEIIERRRYERYYPYVFVTGAVLVAIVLVTWMVLQLTISQGQNELQQTEETIRSLDQQAQALAVFEEQREELERRQNIAVQALAGRIDMGKIIEEISLVLPDSVWLSEVRLSQEAGAVLVGYTPDSVDAEISESYKALAATLVRLNTLSDLYDVWLAQARSEEYTEFQGATGALPAKTVNFEASAKIRPSDTAVSAPPNTAGQ